jgi:hypothetical protein
MQVHVKALRRLCFSTPSPAHKQLTLQIAKRRAEHVKNNPDAEVISLGIGDTTEPLTPTIATAMSEAALSMGTREGYSGCACPPRKCEWSWIPSARCLLQLLKAKNSSG